MKIYIYPTRLRHAISSVGYHADVNSEEDAICSVEVADNKDFDCVYMYTDSIELIKQIGRVYPNIIVMPDNVFRFDDAKYNSLRGKSLFNELRKKRFLESDWRSRLKRTQDETNKAAKKVNRLPDKTTR